MPDRHNVKPLGDGVWYTIEGNSIGVTTNLFDYVWMTSELVQELLEKFNNNQVEEIDQ